MQSTQRIFKADTEQFELIVADRYFNGGGNTNTEKRKQAIETINKIMLNELTDKQREYITAYYIGGEKQKEIAKRYGISNTTVSKTIKAGMRKLKKIGRYINLR